MSENPSDRQPSSVYPSTFTLAALPDDVAPYECDHDAGVCVCVHDWRIEWGNLPKRVAARATYVTDSP